MISMCGAYDLSFFVGDWSFRISYHKTYFGGGFGMGSGEESVGAVRMQYTYINLLMCRE